MTKTANIVSRFLANTRLLNGIWWAIALGIVVGCAMNSISGFDWVNVYYIRAHDPTKAGIANPPWVYFVIIPLAYLPVREAYAVFSLLNVAMLWLTSRLGGAPRFLLLLSFPALWLLWYGQIDAFVALGVALGWWALREQKPALLGLALLLLLVKPHLGAPLAVAYFFWSRDWRALAVSGLVFLLSLVVWRADWPIIWVKSLFEFANPPAGATITTAGQPTNISLFPYGLLTWLILFLPMPRLERAMAIISATFLSVPYAPTYSLLLLLALPVPWWIYLISSVPLVLGPDGYWLTTFAPLGCLGWLVARYLPGFIVAARQENFAGPPK